MKTKTTGPTGMSREQELHMQAEFIEKNGITKLPPDARLFEDRPDWSAWAKRDKDKKKATKLAKQHEAALKKVKASKLAREKKKKNE